MQIIKKDKSGNVLFSVMVEREKINLSEEGFKGHKKEDFALVWMITSFEGLLTSTLRENIIGNLNPLNPKSEHEEYMPVKESQVEDIVIETIENYLKKHKAIKHKKVVKKDNLGKPLYTLSVVLEEINTSEKGDSYREWNITTWDKIPLTLRIQFYELAEQVKSKLNPETDLHEPVDESQVEEIVLSTVDSFLAKLK